MINSVEEYLAELKNQLHGSDRAAIQDALSDAEEYLRAALDNIPSSSAISETQKLALVIEKYGTPAEVAAAYKDIESRTPPALNVRDRIQPVMTLPPPEPALERKRPLYARFFGVILEPRAWGSLFYLVLALATGIIYFTWVVTGISVSFSLLVLIIGLPLAALFLLSVKGIALVEGRLVEALLGVRMPRRPRFSGKSSFWQRLRDLLTDKHVWFSIVYMLLQMPLGIIYFSVFVTLIVTSLGLIFWPIVALALDVPVFVTSLQDYYATGWLIPLTVIAGAVLFLLTMHLAKVVGKAHGLLAKAVLVRL